ncbi:hypothetical protein ACGFR8_27870 [Streptomyces brevispora]|uniref:hypothetical protein n=1 Tax=Streptomyces brevispora TaxID=887462 RepID=UPI00371ABEFF
MTDRPPDEVIPGRTLPCADQVRRLRKAIRPRSSLTHPVSVERHRPREPLTSKPSVLHERGPQKGLR